MGRAGAGRAFVFCQFSRQLHPVRTACASMRLLTNRLPATRAEIAGFTVLSFGCKRSRAGLNHGAEPHTPMTMAIYNRKVWGRRGGGKAFTLCQFSRQLCPVRTACASMCPLANRLPTARAELTASAIPLFGCGMPSAGAASTKYASMRSLTG